MSSGTGMVSFNSSLINGFAVFFRFTKGYLLVKQFERFVLYCKFTKCFHKNKFLIHIIPDFCIRKIPIFANERGYNVFNQINCRYEFWGICKTWGAS